VPVTDTERAVLIEELLDAVPEEIVNSIGPNDNLARGRCIMATATGISALRYFGIQAEPQPVAVEIFNPAMTEWLKEGSPGGLEEAKKRNCHVVAIDAQNESKPGGYNGHLVVRLDNYLLDLDMRQFVRPHKNIAMPVSVIWEVKDDFDDGGLQVYEKNGCWVTYEKLDNPGYKQAPDWRKRDQGDRARTTGRVIRRMRKAAET